MSQDSSPLLKSGKASPAKVDPEVNAKPERRKFSAEYKRRILEEADACMEAGQIGALLRREGLYSSNLTHWRQQMSKGALKALSPKKRGPKPDPLANENAALRRRIERLLRHEVASITVKTARAGLHLLFHQRFSTGMNKELPGQ